MSFLYFKVIDKFNLFQFTYYKLLKNLNTFTVDNEHRMIRPPKAIHFKYKKKSRDSLEKCPTKT